MLNNSGTQILQQVTPTARVELADIVRLHADSFKEQYAITPQQASVMRDLVQCRTAALGGHVDACTDCGALRIAYNSCRNRHCPKCGTLAKVEWLEKQKQHLLPIPYFHVVLTLDHRFNRVARYNQRSIYNLLFQSAATSLKAFGQRYLGGEIGVTAMLHTWGQTLTQHVHLHCLVTGGALVGKGKRWQAADKTYLFPAVPLAAEFRDRICKGLARLGKKGMLSGLEDANAFDKLVQMAQATKWQAYIQPPIGQPEQVLNYLGRYMNRSAISNNRIVAVTDDKVTFRYKDYKNAGQQKTMTLTAIEFIRRFLQHVLPKGFVRIRHYGLLAPRYRKAKLAQCRRLLGHLARQTQQAATRDDLLMQLLGKDPSRCPLCETGSWQRYQTILPHISRRKWVLALS